MTTQASETRSAVVQDTPVSLWNLFTGFLVIGLLGFGGVAASGYYVIVEKRRWLTQKDFVELFGLCTVLPGGNIINASVMIGDRFQGPLGSVVGLTALLLMPLLILISLVMVYDTYSYLPYVRAATAGAASTAAGLIVGTAAKLMKGVDPTPPAFIFGVATFLVVGFLRLPLWVVVIMLAPAAILVLRWWDKRA